MRDIPQRIVIRATTTPKPTGSIETDDCQIHQNHSAENWAMLRHMALNMLRAEPSKVSIPAKQKRAWMKADYLEAALTAGFSEMLN